MLGSQVRTNKMYIYGHPGCIDSAKCLQTAAEKGLNIEAKVVNVENPDAAAVQISPLKVFPALRDIDFIVVGVLGVMSYLDDKGFGISLVPRNRLLRSRMYEWIMLALQYQDRITCSDVAGLAPVLDELNKQLLRTPKKDKFICGEFSLSDIHWSACMNALEIKGTSGEIDTRSELKAWYDRVKKHPSSSKEKIIPFTAVPTADDIKNNRLRDISTFA